MSSKGAKCLVLVSRSASLNDNIKALVKDVGANGTQIVLKACDISNPESVNSLIKEDIKDLPPVRGVIHGTVVLRVSDHCYLFHRTRTYPQAGHDLRANGIGRLHSSDCWQG